MVAALQTVFSFSFSLFILFSFSFSFLFLPSTNTQINNEREQRHRRARSCSLLGGGETRQERDGSLSHTDPTSQANTTAVTIEQRHYSYDDKSQARCSGRATQMAPIEMSPNLAPWLRGNEMCDDRWRIALLSTAFKVLHFLLLLSPKRRMQLTFFFLSRFSPTSPTSPHS